MLVPALLLALAVGSQAPAAPTTSQSAVPSIPYTRFVLDNGLEVLVVEDHRVPLVAVDLWVHVGSGDEEPGKSGFAHLFEHMMFQGAAHIGEDVHFDVLKKAGASNINGTTNSDRTNYYEVVPTQALETALWLESDRLGFLLPMLTDKSLANQRDVVRNERRQRYDNVPYGKERFATAALLWPEGHPYRFMTIGRHEDIEHASTDDVRAFWLSRYAPSNATLALVGDVSVAQARALVTRWFSSLRTAARPSRTVLPEALRRASVFGANTRVDVDDAFARLPRVHHVWHGPAAFTDDDLDLSIVADVLGAPGWGRLYKSLVVEQALAQSVSVSMNAQQLAGSFDIVVTLKPGSDEARVRAIVDDELARLLRDGPTAQEVQRSVVNTEASFVWGLEGLLARAERLQSFGHYVGDPGYTPTYLQRLRARTVATTTKSAQTWLSRPHGIVVTHPVVTPAVAPAVTAAPGASP